jgi:competence protein ComEC
MLSIGFGYYGRKLNPVNLILLAAVITAMANPLYLWRDISWYLSFLAFFGVLVLAPVIKTWLKWRVFNTIAGAVALESICAEIMTLPYVLLMFGQMSQIGLVANVLIVALIPLAMLLGLFSGLTGMFIAPISGYISWPTSILLNYMLDMAHMLAGLPDVFIDGIKFGLGQMLACYFLVTLIVAVIWNKNQKNAKITDREEVV